MCHISEVTTTGTIRIISPPPRAIKNDHHHIQQGLKQKNGLLGYQADRLQLVSSTLLRTPHTYPSFPLIIQQLFGDWVAVIHQVKLFQSTILADANTNIMEL